MSESHVKIPVIIIIHKKVGLDILKAATPTPRDTEDSLGPPQLIKASEHLELKTAHLQSSYVANGLSVEPLAVTCPFKVE